MAKIGGAVLKIFRILIGLILLIYSLCLLSSFFSKAVSDYLVGLGQQYKLIEFIFAGIFSSQAFSHLSLFIGSIYFLASFSILSLKYNPRIGASYILLSIWVFVVFLIALKVKEGLVLGFTDPKFTASVTDFFKIMVPLLLPALFLPLLTGGD